MVPPATPCAWAVLQPLAGSTTPTGLVVQRARQQNDTLQLSTNFLALSASISCSSLAQLIWALTIVRYCEYRPDWDVCPSCDTVESSFCPCSGTGVFRTLSAISQCVSNASLWKEMKKCLYIFTSLFDHKSKCFIYKRRLNLALALTERTSNHFNCIRKRLLDHWPQPQRPLPTLAKPHQPCPIVQKKRKQGITGLSRIIG